MAEGQTDEVVNSNTSFPRSGQWRGEDGFDGHSARIATTDPGGSNLWPPGSIMYARQLLSAGTARHRIFFTKACYDIRD